MDRTLVVDDSPTIRRMVVASLRDVCSGGFQEAATGLEALERLAVGPVALMILDLNMPDMHGLEVLRFVRSHHAFGHIPIVILTTRGDEASRTAVMAAGASLYPCARRPSHRPRAGISPEFLPHLFERFQQADSAANRRHAGLGLGLSLVRQLVELHGGQISVTSTLGQGSRFTVSFPGRADLAPVAGVGVADLAPDADGTALAAIRVLVIADDQDSRDMLAITLEQQGATVVSVASVPDGLAVIANDRRFDVIVASVLHDDADGRLLDALQMLSTRPGGNAIPAIAITSHQHAQLEARLMAAGYNVRLARPVSPPALVSAVLDLVDR